MTSIKRIRTVPSQSSTWGKNIECFEEWRTKQSGVVQNEKSLLSIYLQEQLKKEGRHLPRYQNQPTGLLLDESTEADRIRELLFALLAIKLQGNYEPAYSLIRGERLTQGLAGQYVAMTNCYGERMETV